MTIDPWFVGRLACPWDGAPLRAEGDEWRCACGRRFPDVDGIPVLLRDDVRQTHGGAELTRAAVSGAQALDYGAGGTPEEVADTVASREDPTTSRIDPYVQEAIGMTNGFLYQHLVGKLREYPIPEIRLPRSEGDVLLDIGCGWGRWSFAAARRGYEPVGIDPQLVAVRAAQRVARQLGVTAHFACADARYLPFLPGTFHVVYSYSVLQHFSKDDVREALAAIRRVLREDGVALIQMPNAFGIRSLQHQARRAGRAPQGFDVRYWTPGELRAAFDAEIGHATLSVDGYFSLNPQASDLHLLPLHFRAIVRASDALRAASRRLPPLLYAADSLFVEARRAKDGSPRGVSRAPSPAPGVGAD